MRATSSGIDVRRGLSDARSLKALRKASGMISGYGQAGVPFRTGRKQRDDVEMLVRFLVNALAAGLGGEGHNGARVHIGVGYAGD